MENLVQLFTYRSLRVLYNQTGSFNFLSYGFRGQLLPKKRKLLACARFKQDLVYFTKAPFYFFLSCYQEEVNFYLFTFCLRQSPTKSETNRFCSEFITITFCKYKWNAETIIQIRVARIIK